MCSALTAISYHNHEVFGYNFPLYLPFPVNCMEPLILSGIKNFMKSSKL